MKILRLLAACLIGAIVADPVEAAGRGSAVKPLKEIFNDAAGFVRQADPPPTKNLDYNPPPVKPDPEKLTVDDAKVIKNTLPDPKP